MAQGHSGPPYPDHVREGKTLNQQVDGDHAYRDEPPEHPDPDNSQGPDLPLTISCETFVNERGGESERTEEIREFNCPDCGYDRCVTETDHYRGTITKVTCRFCDFMEFPYTREPEVLE